MALFVSYIAGRKNEPSSAWSAGWVTLDHCSEPIGPEDIRAIIAAIEKFNPSLDNVVPLTWHKMERA